MFIDPIQMASLGGINPIGQADRQSANTSTTGAGFQDIFKNAWNSASDSQQDLLEKQYLQSIGEIDDTHTVPIAVSKAELSISLLVGIRNKALESYNELMRISV